MSYPSPPNAPGGYAPRPARFDVPYRRLIRQNANLAGAAVVLFTLLSFLLSRLWQLAAPYLMSFFPSSLFQGAAYTASLLIYCFSLGAACLVMARMLRIPANTAFPLRIPRADIVIAALCISLGARIVGGILVSRVAFAIEAVSGFMPTMPSFPVPSTPGAYAVYFISVAVAPAFFEEALFRGVILQSLRRFGDHFAVMASSVLFAVMHGNLLQGPYSLLLGLLIGYFVIITGSLWTGAAIHFLNNLIAVLLEYAMTHMGGASYEVFGSGFLIASVVLAIGGLIYMRLRYGSLFYLRRSDYPLPEGKKYTSFFSAAMVLVAIGISLFQSWTYLI